MCIEDYIAVALFGLLVSCTTPSVAKTLAVASHGGVSVHLTNEECRLDAVKNLPSRAIWNEGGKVFEGCYGLSDCGIVAYFDDNTVVVMPVALFSASHEI